MNCFFSNNFTLFYYHSQLIWIYFNSEKYRLESSILKKLHKIISNTDIQPQNISAFSYNLPEIFNKIIDENLRMNSKNIIDLDKNFWDFEVNNKTRFYLSFQLFLYDNIKLILKQLKNKDSNKYKTLNKEIWNLSKILNSLSIIYIPELTEEDNKKISKIIYLLYGHNLSISNIKTINERLIIEISNSISNLIKILSSQIDIKEIYLQNNLYSIINSSIDINLKIYFLILVIENFISLLRKI